MDNLSELGISPGASELKEVAPILSRDTVRRIVAVAGTDETKLLTIAAMEPGVYYSQRPLAYRVERFLSGYPTPYVGKSNYITYCERGLGSVGLVTSHTSTDDKNRGNEFSISPMGARLGVALAGHLLEFSENHPETSLLQLAGNSTTPTTATQIDTTQETPDLKKKSLETRFNIFYELLTASLPMRMIDLATALHIDRATLLPHVKHLRDSGRIEYESIDSIQPIVLYRPGNIPPTPEYFSIQKYPILTKEIYEAVRAYTEENDATWASIEDVEARVSVRTTGAYKSGEGATATRFAVLKLLAKDGLLTKQKFDKDMKSIISLSNDQRALLLEYTSILDKFENQDEQFLQKGIQKAQAILADPVRVHALMTKAKENSSNTDPIPLDEMKRITLEIFPEGETDASVIASLLQKVLGKHIDAKYTRRFLNMLTNEGKIAVRNDKNRKYWRLIPAEVGIEATNAS